MGSYFSGRCKRCGHVTEMWQAEDGQTWCCDGAHTMPDHYMEGVFE